MSVEQGARIDRVLEHVGGDDHVESVAGLVGQPIVEVGLDEAVEAFADAFVLDDVDADDVVTVTPDERTEAAVGAADVEHDARAASSTATTAAHRATSAAMP